MPTPIINTSVSFSYPVPDSLFGQVDSEGKTVSAIYSGPDRAWVFVDADTGIFDQSEPVFTSKDDGADLPTPLGYRKVEIVAQDNPLIMSLILTNNTTLVDTIEESEELPDGNVFIFPIRSPGNTYDNRQLTHNGTNWEPLIYRSSDITWDDVLNRRNGLLVASDGRISPDMPEPLKATWVEYRRKLRDITITYGKGTENEVEAWKVQLPLPPQE